MKMSKLLLVSGAAILLYAGLGFLIFDKARDGSVSDGGARTATYMAYDDDAPQYREGDAIPDSALPQAKLPTLQIGGQEDPDVYLQSLDIKVEVTGNIASTRYTMVFRNNTGKTLEGELTFPLPDGRTATHYALDVNGRMREAVPVEKVWATQVFEEIQQRQVVIDPGVLEKVEGNNYRTRIYPFPPRATRTISVGYEEELSLEKGLLYYRLPMAYPSALEKFSVTATVWNSSKKPLVPASDNEIRFDKSGENYEASYEGKNYRPSRALVFALPSPVNMAQVMMQSAQGSHYFLASAAPKRETRKKQWSDDLAVIWDVSLSGSQRNLEHEIKLLDVIFADKKNANVRLYFLNNRLKEITAHNSGNGGYRVADGNWDALKKVLEGAIFDGGTDFSQINLNNIKGGEVIFFSDGLSTLSDADFIKKARANRPVHCVVSSSMADYSAMKLIAGKTGGKFININALSYESLKDEALNETLQFLGTEHGAAVREVYPSVATPVQGNFSVAGIMSGNNAEVTLLFGFGSKVERRMTVKLDARKAGTTGNVYRIWAQKKIEELDLDFGKNRGELTELGKQFGIVTRNTSLIVLETADDYARFGIEPPASEPELLASYRALRNRRNSDVRDLERDMLASAVSTALDMQAWLDTKFDLPQEPKYPVPDNNQHAGGISQSRGSQTQTDDEEFIERRPEGRTARLTKGEETWKADETGATSSNQMKLSPRSERGSGMAGGGDPRARVTQMGVLGIVSGQVQGRSTTSADIFGKGGFASDIDEILRGVGGLKSGGDGGTGRTGAAGIGYGSGFGGSGGGLDGLLGGSGGIDLKKRGELKVSSPDFLRIKAENARADSLKKAADAAIELLRKQAEREAAGYLKTMTGNMANDYQEYLKLRNEHTSTPKFYFDMAGWFYKHGDRETALRVLTSIAELSNENAPLYRMLGYRFKEYGEHTLQKFVCGKVMEWRPQEPQSYRDYALALADNGERQAALDSLYALLTKSYSAHVTTRCAGIDEVVITEINRLIAKYPRMSMSKVDKRLRMSMPADVRVVLNWNHNNVNIDLIVEDPLGNESFFGGHWPNYGRYATNIGGRMSDDNSRGYGPEQFMLKRGVKGTYRVYAAYRSAREFAETGPVTVMAEIYTKYGTKDERREVVTAQLTRGQGRWSTRGGGWGGWTGDINSNKILIGEFEL